MAPMCGKMAKHIMLQMEEPIIVYSCFFCLWSPITRRLTGVPVQAAL